MSKTKGHDYSTLLIWAAALVVVVRYSAAFIASDVGQISGWLSDVITFGMGISGLGMGILDVIGGTYLFDGWRRAMPREGKHWSLRFKVLTGLVFSLAASGVMILVPFTMSRVIHESMDALLGTGAGLIWWSLLVNLTPYILIGGVALSNQVVMVTSVNLPESSPKVSGLREEPSGNFPTDWRKVRAFLTDTDILAVSRMSTAEIRSKYYLKTAKTAQNWRRYAQEEISKKIAAMKGNEK